MSTKILVIDDDTNICEMLRVYLENEGYEVKTANDGAEGVAYFKMYEPDLVLLDIMLPRKDGWQVCREIREVSNKPIIMVTAKGEVFDKVLGFELGADDFMVKPLEMKELSVRVKAMLRRCATHDTTVDDETVKFDNIEISRMKYELKIKGKSVDIPRIKGIGQARLSPAVPAQHADLFGKIGPFPVAPDQRGTELSASRRCADHKIHASHERAPLQTHMARISLFMRAQHDQCAPIVVSHH